MLLEWIIVGAGGFVGATARFGCSLLIAQSAPHNPSLAGTFPLATLVVNWTGCLLIGIVAALVPAHDESTRHLRLLLATGLLGGFTTFSSFALELSHLIDAGRWVHAGIYLMLTNVGCVVLALASMKLMALR